MTAAGFRKLLTRVAECSSISLTVHAHLLRHACGCATRLVETRSKTFGMTSLEKTPLWSMNHDN